MMSTPPSMPAPAGEPHVAMRRVVKSFPVGRGGLAIRPCDDISLTIRRGEALGLVGETGCGKSTVARLLVGMLRPDGGDIIIGGTAIQGLGGSGLKAMRRQVQLVFQNPYAALDPRMRIVRSLEAPLLAHGIGDAATRRRRIVDMLGEVGLDSALLDRLPHECSGGQLQRVVIARALLLEPSVLVCDEPTSALDASVRAQILNLLADLKSRFSLTMLMISHDLRVVRFLCDRIAVMYLGQIVEEAPTAAMFARRHHPYAQALFAACMLDDAALLEAGAMLQGEPPSPLTPPSGCRFRDRCSHAEPRCAAAAPAEDIPGDGRRVRCHRWRELSAL